MVFHAIGSVHSRGGAHFRLPTGCRKSEILRLMWSRGGARRLEARRQQDRLRHLGSPAARPDAALATETARIALGRGHLRRYGDHDRARLRGPAALGPIQRARGRLGTGWLSPRELEGLGTKKSFPDWSTQTTSFAPSAWRSRRFRSKPVLITVCPGSCVARSSIVTRCCRDLRKSRRKTATSLRGLADAGENPRRANPSFAPEAQRARGAVERS